MAKEALSESQKETVRQNMRKPASQRMSQAALADSFGVGAGTVNRFIQRERKTAQSAQETQATLTHLSGERGHEAKKQRENRPAHKFEAPRGALIQLPAPDASVTEVAQWLMGLGTLALGHIRKNDLEDPGIALKVADLSFKHASDLTRLHYGMPDEAREQEEVAEFVFTDATKQPGADEEAA